MTFSESLQNYRYELMLTITLLLVLYSNIIAEMVVDWWRDDNYSHGFLVPLIAGYFIRERWNDLKTAKVSPANIGLVVIACALMQLLIATLGNEYFTTRSSLIVLIAGMVLFFAVKYKRRHADEVGTEFHESALLEMTWTVIPLIIVLFTFAWGAQVFFRLYRPIPLAP